MTHISDFKKDILMAPWVRFKANAIWDKLLHLSEPIFTMAGDYLIKPGKQANGIYLLRHGQVKVSAKTKAGLLRTLFTMSEESVIGDIPVFCEKEYQHYIQAISDCRLSFFPSHILHKIIIPLHPNLTNWLFKNMSTKASIANSLVEETTFYNINIRVARLIYLFINEKTQKNHEGKLEINISQGELAEKLGAHRVTITKAINYLKNKGLISSRPSWIIIDDLEGLEKFLFEFL